jgi:hypothetical protein
MITLHKNSNRTFNKKDIQIKFLNNFNEKLQTIEFRIPKKISCKMSDPNATYLSRHEIEFDSRLKNAVWVDASYEDIDHMFDNFHLAIRFIINKYVKAISTNNRYDKETKTMYLSY